MGGVDKGLVPLHGKPMIAHVIDALRSETRSLLINANRNADRYAEFGYPVIPDLVEGYQGPLAGMASGLHHADTPYIVTAACDSPRIGHDLVPRLYQALHQSDAEISVAHDGERMHPVLALIRRELLPSLLDFMQSGQRKIDRWYSQHKLAIAYFPDQPEAFPNGNSPEEHAELENELELMHR